MDLALTESQEMLKTTARAFMEREAPTDVIVGLQQAESSLAPELKNAPGIGPRPSSSYTTAAVLSVSPLPPYSAGIRMPSHPRSAAFLQSSAVGSDSVR